MQWRSLFDGLPILQYETAVAKVKNYIDSIVFQCLHLFAGSWICFHKQEFGRKEVLNGAWRYLRKPKLSSHWNWIGSTEKSCNECRSRISRRDER